MAFLEQGNTFSDTVVNSRLESVNSFLKEVDSLIDFNKLKPILKKNSIGTKNSCGVKAYDPLLMFKIVLLQKFYNLSDVRVENELKVNLLYIKFVGLSLEDATPDSTTIGRFRNSLINNNIYDELFDEVNKQLSIKGFIANSGKDVLVDATLVKSNNNRIKDKSFEERTKSQIRIENDNKQIDSQIEEELRKTKPSAKKISRLLKKKSHNSKTLKNEEIDNIQERDSKDINTSKEIIKNQIDSYEHNNRIDKDIRIGYQASKKQFSTGYKNHIATDEKSGAILAQLTTFANTSDISTIDTFVELLENKNNNILSLCADKAYKSEEIDKLLKNKNIQNNICLKQIKGIKESCKQIQKESEKPKHKVRAKVEHMFALIKTTVKQESTRYIGLLRNNLNFTIVCIAANLKLFAHKQIKQKEVKNR